MPTGGTITIETANVALGEPVWAEEPAAGNYVAVGVSDTGTGIPDDVRERMFEPFFTTKGIGKGSGLGLPQVLGVVKQLGGGLAVRSRLGEGASISIFLPRAEECAAAGATASSIQVADEPTSERVARILVVDDDADVRSIAAAMLDDAGYKVVEATSGASALDALERANGQTALVLADVSMPGINGADFAAIVGRTWPAVPVLLMTGYANSGLLREGGGQEVLRKPFTAGELRKKVAQAMTRMRSGRADLGIAR
jgi:CheY-like chemotaxis protein